MEKHAFIKTFDRLMGELNIKEIVTDAHVQIASLMHPEKGRYKDQGVVHSLDIWHAAKNLTKRLHAAGTTSGQSQILVCLKDVVNHFWFSCQKACNREEFMVNMTHKNTCSNQMKLDHFKFNSYNIGVLSCVCYDLPMMLYFNFTCIMTIIYFIIQCIWRGVLHHVCGEHELFLGRCLHAPLDEETANKEVIPPGSAAHEALSQIVLNRRWLKDVEKFLTFRSTSELESFQNHILMYAGKRFSFSPPVYEARTLLAALDTTIITTEQCM
ncbi:uncharacterized protein [Misgurnus anguillicaudatus]|uniref:uncharacterized protein isoform X1 n=1 Tax=Misgurnus anguillicaudatus TaxID=75329 RepID=UPI003CCFA909